MNIWVAGITWQDYISSNWPSKQACLVQRESLPWKQGDTFKCLSNAYFIELLEFLDWLSIFLYYQGPSLEHNGKVIGESLDLIKYVDSNFGCPSLQPDVRFA